MRLPWDDPPAPRPRLTKPEVRALGKRLRRLSMTLAAAVAEELNESVKEADRLYAKGDLPVSLRQEVTLAQFFGEKCFEQLFNTATELSEAAYEVVDEE